LEDIGIWNNIETIENNLAKMKTKKEKRTALKQQINMCKVIVHIYFYLVKRGSNLTFNS
jgi:hypothetical protein